MSEVTTPADGSAAASVELAEELVARARAAGGELVGPGGLLTDLTKTVLETALEVEMDDHLGYPKHAVEGNNSGNSRNGTRSKSVLTEVDEVQIEVPRDREGSFEPKIVRNRQRRLAGVDELVISLAAKGLTTGEIAAHFQDVYGAEVSKDTISRITDAVIEELAASQSRPLDTVYPVVQTCVLLLIRNTFRYASRARWEELARDLRPIYTASTEEAAKDRLDELDEKWGETYPAIIRLWRNAWVEFVPFLACKHFMTACSLGKWPRGRQ